MADENDAPQPEASQSKGGGKLPMKTIAIVLGLLIGEGVAVFVVVGMLGKPGEVQAVGVETMPDNPGDQISEMLVVSGRFPNDQSGRVWLWETEVQIQVKQKHQERVQKTLEDRKAEITTGINKIIRNAHHRHLTEPDLNTLGRQLEQYLGEVIGKDNKGEDRVRRVFIPKCVGFPADY